ncbi:phosphatase PAP2 family protein [Vibrio ishigakensis]|nr:phosphatase PAP2 family protein [Vibrio ishigakensis]
MIRRISLLTSLLFATHSMAGCKTETAGDIGQFLIPLTALGVSWYKDDTEGMGQLGKGVLYTGLATHGLKLLIEAERPNGKNFNSFPSGHTSAAFSGAAFLHHRYGWEYGLPAYMAASYVGYSRVYATKHWKADVLAGAALAITVSYLVTSKYQDPNLSVAPYQPCGTDAQGISLSYTF